MTTKRKKKNTMNAIDKYLRQRRYTQAKKCEEMKERTERKMQVVVPKVSGEVYSTVALNGEGEGRSLRSSRCEVPNKVDSSNKFTKWKPVKNNGTDKRSPRNFKKLLQVELPKLPRGVLQKSSRTEQAIVGNSSAKPKGNVKNKTRQVNQKRSSEKEGKQDGQIKLSSSRRKTRKYSEITKKSASAVPALSTRKRVNRLRRDAISSDKFESSSRNVNHTPKHESNVRNTVNDRKNGVGGLKQNEKAPYSKKFCDGQEDQVSSALHPVNEANIVADSSTKKDSIKKSSENANCCLPKKRRKFVEETETATASTSDTVYEPCCSSSNIVSGGDVDSEIIEEITPITKKYQPYMERLKFLSSDDIQKYIKDNQQYYVDYKKEIESKISYIPLTAKKLRRDEMKESFKCNPFNSEQQLAMYYTLREIFNVPKTHFMECRTLFTVLLPEISCQLFAETFRIKVSFAPRLIKKLYPNPVCPV